MANQNNSVSRLTVVGMILVGIIVFQWYWEASKTSAGRQADELNRLVEQSRQKELEKSQTAPR
jgi:hypothetical protein